MKSAFFFFFSIGTEKSFGQSILVLRVKRSFGQAGSNHPDGEIGDCDRHHHGGDIVKCSTWVWFRFCNL